MNFLRRASLQFIKKRSFSWNVGLLCTSPLSRRSIAVMAGRSYEDALDCLNSLQTPFKVLEERRKAGIRIDENANQQMRQCLARIGYSQADLDRLNIVHVAGTKGKGSTCSFVDSILCHYRTSHDRPKNIGLFTSPHLIAVRERFRINSKPISPEAFAKYFFEVWDSLESAAVDSNVPILKPVYFRYLTLMSYHVFLSEGVDVAVYEVGVGGEYDATNIVERPAAVGISTLGIDHTFTLGETVDKIAWHKAGILKHGSAAFSVPQLEEAIQVVKQRAEERNVLSLRIVETDPRLQGVKIRPDAAFQRGNASLAIALTETVLKKLDPSFELPSDELPSEFVKGLENVVWRGRCETKVEGNIRWYLDGAHTVDSIKVAARWFAGESSESPKPATSILIFNQQGEHEALKILEELHKVITVQGLAKFEQVIFCTNAPRVDADSKRDHVNHTYDSTAITNLTLQKSFATKWATLDPSPTVTIKVLPSIEDAFDYVRKLDSAEGGKDGEKKETHALVTGSLHLVGRALAVLEGPDAL